MPRATTDALLRLRQADENEALRALQRARDAVETARAARERAVAERRALYERLQRLPPDGPRTAGALRRRDNQRAQLRAHLAAATEQVTAAARTLRDCERTLDEAQRALEQALRAREAAKSHRDSEEKTESRRRERREQAASDDRWRPPRR